MRDTLLILLLLAVVALGYFLTIQQRQIKAMEAQSRTNGLELQDKCAKESELVFKRGGWDEKGVIASFTNHYNAKLNRCFMEVERTDPTIVANTVFETKFVVDAFEGKPYAEYTWKTEAGKKYWEVTPSECSVTLTDGTRKACKSAEEFSEQIRPYMEH